jgi:glutamate carboxypeptidase
MCSEPRRNLPCRVHSSPGPDQAAKRLFGLYVQSAADTGFATEGEFAGGCADSCFTAGVGVVTVRAVGPIGGKTHSLEEFMCIDTQVPRARAILRVEGL